MKAAQAAQTLREQGIDVIDLTLGEPDFDTPQFIKDYAIEGMQKGLTKYTPTPGLKNVSRIDSRILRDAFRVDFSPA